MQRHESSHSLLLQQLQFLSHQKRFRSWSLDFDGKTGLRPEVGCFESLPLLLGSEPSVSIFFGESAVSVDGPELLKIAQVVSVQLQ